MTLEHSVARHYLHGGLEQAILQALAAGGKDSANINADDLAPADEFHIGGRQATADFAAVLGARPGMQLLDIGSGIGGPARYFAQHHGCHVTGIDLSDEYVEVARSLSRRAGLGDRMSFRQGSALDLPFPPASFDGAYMLHVGMNIENKAALFAQVRRVLRPGAPFGIYDIMRESDREFVYPVPWSAAPETNFIAGADTYRTLLAAAGFTVLHERNRRDFAIDFFRRMQARMAESGPPPLGLQIIMGPSAPQKIGNMVALIKSGVIAPTEIVCRPLAP